MGSSENFEPRIRLAYITSRTPWGSEEAFVLDEIAEHMEFGWQVFVFPVHPDVHEVFHGQAAAVLPTARNFGWFDSEVRSALRDRIRRYPKQTLQVLLRVVRASANNPRALAKNLVVFPKALCIADHVDRLGIQHIHAHWASTPTTCAYIAAELSGVTYSFTSHAWDLYIANNMIVEKTNRSAFAIAVTHSNLKYLAGRYPRADISKVRVLNPGIRLNDRRIVEKRSRGNDIIRLVCVARLVEKKGHYYLLKALDLLKGKGYVLECLLVGDGVLRKDIAEQVRRLDLTSVVSLVGKMPHEEVLNLLSGGSIDIFVLPSVVLDDGQREGLPFSLMEAMACGIPVTSTNTAGIPELVVDGAGLLVEQRNAGQLAQALEKLIREPKLRESIGRAGQAEVEKRFNLHRNAAILREMICEAVTP